MFFSRMQKDIMVERGEGRKEDSRCSLDCVGTREMCLLGSEASDDDWHALPGSSQIFAHVPQFSLSRRALDVLGPGSRSERWRKKSNGIGVTVAPLLYCLYHSHVIQMPKSSQNFKLLSTA